MAGAAPVTAQAAQAGPQHGLLISSGQVSFFIAFAYTLVLYLYALALHKRRTREAQLKAHLSDPDIESKAGAAAGEHAPLINGSQASTNGDVQFGKAAEGKPAMLQNMLGSGLVRCMLLDQHAVYDAREALQAMVEFGGIMLWFLLCDRTSLLPGAEKEYSRDLFMFLFLLLFLVAVSTSLKPVRTPLLLNRPQTEEWKGWMQVLFLLYHYFEAREAYNAIRVFIAGYVWMTGFGNFSYYYRTNDFGIGRFCQMMWRLNFLVFFCCVVLQNSYMLYYICPMHTIFTIMVYASLAILPQYNKNAVFMWSKLALCFVSVFILWDIKAVFYGMWQPFDWLVGYSDPRKGPGQDRMHEWHFRSSLDRWIWIYGMICAYLHPSVTKILVSIDEMPMFKRYGARTSIVAVVCALFGVYYQQVFALPKKEYNVLHPYTSWIPLTLWIILRNMTPKMRTYSMSLFGWLGCITLETYLCQFHIWLRSEVPDGQPKLLLSLVPGYPLINFAVCSALYVYISYRLFNLTNTLKDKFVPHDDNTTLLRNGFLMLALLAFSYGIGCAVERTVVYALL